MATLAAWCWPWQTWLGGAHPRHRGNPVLHMAVFPAHRTRSAHRAPVSLRSCSSVLCSPALYPCVGLPAFGGTPVPRCPHGLHKDLSTLTVASRASGTRERGQWRDGASRLVLPWPAWLAKTPQAGRDDHFERVLCMKGREDAVIYKCYDESLVWVGKAIIQVFGCGFSV